MPRHTHGEHTYTYTVHTMNTDPHNNEYLAAVAGLHEQTPSPRQHVYAVGDFVSGTSAGVRWQGRIEWINDDGSLVVHDGSSLTRYSPADVTH